jgi:acylphosphatase
VIDEAERVGLKGWVRNLPDGRVEAEVVGPEPVLEEFAKRLEIGPRTSHVTSVGIERLDDSVVYTEFRIR